MHNLCITPTLLRELHCPPATIRFFELHGLMGMPMSHIQGIKGDFGGMMAHLKSIKNIICYNGHVQTFFLGDVEYNNVYDGREGLIKSISANQIITFDGIGRKREIYLHNDTYIEVVHYEDGTIGYIGADGYVTPSSPIYHYNSKGIATTIDYGDEVHEFEYVYQDSRLRYVIRRAPAYSKIILDIGICGTTGELII